jgi:hypothetical protein
MLPPAFLLHPIYGKELILEVSSKPTVTAIESRTSIWDRIIVLKAFFSFPKLAPQPFRN